MKNLIKSSIPFLILSIVFIFASYDTWKPFHYLVTDIKSGKTYVAVRVRRLSNLSWNNDIELDLMGGGQATLSPPYSIEEVMNTPKTLDKVE